MLFERKEKPTCTGCLVMKDVIEHQQRMINSLLTKLDIHVDNPGGLVEDYTQPPADRLDAEGSSVPEIHDD